MVSLDDIRLAQRRLSGVAVRTPLILCPRHQADRRLYFKPENLQPVGAFKLRGAYNKIASLSEAERRRGVIAFSSGNHAQGVAYAARALGVRAVIVMPETAPRVKVSRTAAMGAEIVLLGEGGEEQWRVRAEELAAAHGYVMVAPFNDETVIAGQGTVGLEILEDLLGAGTVLVPVGGGGLLSGVAAAIKLSRPDVRVIGVEPELANDAQVSFRSGRIVEFPLDQTRRTVADGMRATRLGDITFAHIRAFADDIITVSEDEIREATRRLALGAHLVAEPSGAVTFAAFLFHRQELPEALWNVAILSGGNIAPETLRQILTDDPV
ncbi:MAG: threonine/serine dehydratase [Candidatus Latescibacteria bacterium]|nr:threonine/serine dehydratase [Candidatus Latescibacterota bacterium]